MKKSILTPLQGACEYTTYAYDGWGALTNTVYSDGTPTVSVLNDALGRQVEAHDAAGVTTFVYDAYGANTNETIVGIAGTNVLERFADAYGRDVGYALNGERRTVISRDPATGRIITMRVAGCTNDFAWTYHPGCDLKHTLRYPNGALVSWEYEPRRDLMTLVSNDVYSSFRYTYDGAGKRTSKNDEHYFYNARGELILATNVVTGAEFAYRYDDIGNRLWSREFGTNCTYAANGLNQYTGIVRGGVSERAAFDLDGNQTNVVTATGEWAVEYNGENRPVRWTRTLDGATVLMAYDRMGRRVMKDDETFVYDGYLNVVQTVWDPTEPVATRPLVWLDVGKDSYYFHDGNKNVVGLVSGNGLEWNCSTYDYAPYGASLSLADANPWRFSSEYRDAILELSYYNYRHYNGMVGRWLSRDRNEERGGLNLFEAVSNAPHELCDFLGLKCDKYGSPRVVETKIDPGAWSEWKKVVVFVDARERALSDLPILFPDGGINISAVTCDCVYKIVETRSRNVEIRERKLQTYRCEFKENCNTTSLTYEEDLGWSSRTVQENDAKSDNISFSVRPFGGGIAGNPIDCFTPCRLAPPS